MNDYDNLTLFVKKKKAKEIVEHYNLFGWELVKAEENDLYEDLVDLSFIRPHKIENKDDLQLLQVYMEEKLNEAAKAQRRRYEKSTILGLTAGIFGAMLIGFGLLISLASTLLDFAWGIVFASMGAVLLILSFSFLPKMIKKERVTYQKKKIILDEEIDAICEQAVKLRGEHE